MNKTTHYHHYRSPKGGALFLGFVVKHEEPPRIQVEVGAISTNFFKYGAYISAPSYIRAYLAPTKPT